MKVSAETPDWSREKPRGYWDPGRRLLRSIRKYQQATGRGTALGKLFSKYWVLQHKFWSTVTQCELHLSTRIDGGLLMPHPQGIIIHSQSTIGPNCLIFQQVTLAGKVTLGGHVDVGAGAKILGPVTIGDHAQIGANAVVTKDVPAGATVAGIPARILKVENEVTS